jgi:pSer/pThr/pTyr-binding forkhead associated (FHA) protein
LTANHTDFISSKNEIFLGRGKNCDVILLDKKVSRKNAVLLRDGLKVVIQDLKSFPQRTLICSILAIKS